MSAVPNLSGTRGQIVEDNFLTDRGWGCVCDSLGMIQAHYIYCALFLLLLHQLHLSSSDIRSWRLGTLALHESLQAPRRLTE